ncbi:MAG TPA: hypothetical protein DCR46_07335 [Cytophagales bacterium]|nr:hypothetical protein [Cytophagales bacterium]
MQILNTIASLLSEKTINIGVVINYCTNDYQFLKHCISQATLFSKSVIVPYTDHFYDGTPENLNLLDLSIKENPSAQFVKFDYNANLDVPSQHWVTYARWIGLQALENKIDYVIFLDADEVFDGQRMKTWLQKTNLFKYAALKLSNYYYFRETKYRAETLEDSAVIVKRDQISYETIMDYLDRESIYQGAVGKKKRMTHHMDGKPMIHHYSWVRTKNEMLKKVISWGHNTERDWVQMVENEFEHEFSGKDFVHGHNYKTVEPYIVLK